MDEKETVPIPQGTGLWKNRGILWKTLWKTDAPPVENRETGSVSTKACPQFPQVFHRWDFYKSLDMTGIYMGIWWVFHSFHRLYYGCFCC